MGSTYLFVDDDTQDDLFNNASDEEEGADEETEQEKWRLERHEREKFLQEHQVYACSIFKKKQKHWSHYFVQSICVQLQGVAS